MSTVLRFLAGLMMAVAAHTLGLQLHPRAPELFDPFIILVIYFSMRSTAAPSALVGSTMGLAQDALTGGLFGLHGFANTAVAYLVAAVRQRFVIQQPSQVAVLAALGGLFQLALLTFLQLALVPMSEAPHIGLVVAKTVATGMLTLMVYLATNRLFAWDRRRRELRNRKIRLGT